jgi:hypothetical protein
MIVFHNFFNLKYYNYFLEKYKDLPITIFMDQIPTVEQLKLNPYNIMLIHEPNELFGIHNWVYSNSKLFDCVLTYNPQLIKNLPNTIYFHFGLINTLDKEYYNSFETKEKQFEVSFLSGTKDLIEGHKLRQKVYKLENQVNIPKKWFYVLEDYDTATNCRPGYSEYSKDLSHIPEYEAPEHYGKRVLFNDSMFHIAIENSSSSNYYSEKIIQAFATKTIPIYWGCQNLDNLGYDTRGVIFFKDEFELLEIINNLTPEDYYKRKSYIDYNYKIALQDTFRTRLDKFLTELAELNNL